MQALTQKSDEQNSCSVSLMQRLHETARLHSRVNAAWRVIHRLSWYEFLSVFECDRREAKSKRRRQRNPKRKSIAENTAMTVIRNVDVQVVQVQVTATVNGIIIERQQYTEWRSIKKAYKAICNWNCRQMWHSSLTAHVIDSFLFYSSPRVQCS